MPPAFAVAVEHRHLIAERREIARHRQRGRARRRRTRCACRSSAAARLRQMLGDVVVLEVGGDALQAADRDRLGLGGLRLLDAAAPAGRLARAVAGAAEDAGEDVRLPVDHVGVGVAAGRDQADVFGDGGVGRAGPLAIDDLVEVVGGVDIGRLQRIPFPRARAGGARGQRAVAHLRCGHARPRPGALSARVCAKIVRARAPASEEPRTQGARCDRRSANDARVCAASRCAKCRC